jgi:hypothetical protein
MSCVFDLRQKVIDIENEIDVLNNDICQELCKRVLIKYFYGARSVENILSFSRAYTVMEFHVYIPITEKVTLNYNCTKHNHYNHLYSYDITIILETKKETEYFAQMVDFKNRKRFRKNIRLLDLSSTQLSLIEKLTDSLSSHHLKIHEYLESLYEYCIKSNHVPIFHARLTFLMSNARLRIFPRDIALIIAHKIQ